MTHTPVPAQRSHPRQVGAARRALIVDVDGVVSAVRPQPGSLPWGDEQEVGNLFGPVLTSPAMRRRLNALNQLPDVACWWLTSWSGEMRARMISFPGAAWPVIAEPDLHSEPATDRRGWWKLAAVESWLAQHPEVRDVAWCDDHLRGGRPAAVRRRFATRGLNPPLLLAPNTRVGLAPKHLVLLEAWATRPVPSAAASDPVHRAQSVTG
jgi:hypothetical protein